MFLAVYKYVFVTVWSPAAWDSGFVLISLSPGPLETTSLLLNGPLLALLAYTVKSEIILFPENWYD